MRKLIGLYELDFIFVHDFDVSHHFEFAHGALHLAFHIFGHGAKLWWVLYLYKLELISRLVGQQHVLVEQQ